MANSKTMRLYLLDNDDGELRELEVGWFDSWEEVEKTMRALDSLANDNATRGVLLPTAVLEKWRGRPDVFVDDCGDTYEPPRDESGCVVYDHEWLRCW